jgi:lysozyme
MTSGVDVIDVSHHQATVDFDKVARAGVVGVILKCTEGQSVKDKTHQTRRAQAMAAGLEVASYHFLRPGDMAKQMKFYLDTLSPRDGERVVIDHEDEKVPLSDLVDATNVLLNDDRGLQVTIYSGHLIKEQLGNAYNFTLAKTSLWIAQYGPAVSWPKGTWPTWTLWQYSDKGAVPGVSGNCDVNHFNGSAVNCKRWMTPMGELSPGSSPQEPATEGDTMTINIDTTADIRKIIVKINGVIQF